MSCWVVPAVAAEYWGVSLDAVWGRIYDDHVPHKVERGFVFVDLDPWRGDSSGGVRHEPPPTFVLADDSDEPAADTDYSQSPFEVDSFEAARSRDRSADDNGEADEDPPDERADEQQLPELDEEESAAFGRLSWQEARERVSRTRRPPPCNAQ